MTELLCLSDSYMRECDARVAEAADDGSVVLDRTVFYPRGGGQPGDSGYLDVSGVRFRVSNVAKRDGKVMHGLEAQPGRELKPGDHVRCVLDWERRYRLMRMHTAAHVLGATMHRELNVLITGNELGEERTRFDFSLESFDKDTFGRMVALANESLERGIELKIYTLPRDEAMKIPGVVKLAAALPPSISELRIVEIPGIDTQADGGTHVRNTREAGSIELLKLENKGKINRRIYFTLAP